MKGARHLPAGGAGTVESYSIGDNEGLALLTWTVASSVPGSYVQVHARGPGGQVEHLAGQLPLDVTDQPTPWPVYAGWAVQLVVTGPNAEPLLRSEWLPLTP